MNFPLSKKKITILVYFVVVVSIPACIITMHPNIFLVILTFILIISSSFVLGAWSLNNILPFVDVQKYVFSIGIYQGKSPFDLIPSSDICNPVLSKYDITDREADFVADPFMISEENTWYMFFEVMNSKTKRGEIGLATSYNGLNWDYNCIVLEEDFHLSYPYVFKYGNRYLMVPESVDNYSIRLYEANPFPQRWVYTTTLLQGPYSDASIIKYDNLWWLFVTDSSKCDSLRLFYSTDLFDKWIEHPQSPIIVNNPHEARPAGKPIYYNGNLYRFCQDDYPDYGIRVYGFKIVKLNTDIYVEEKIADKPILYPTGRGWNGKGMHHVDLHECKNGSWIACVDGWNSRITVLNMELHDNRFNRLLVQRVLKVLDQRLK